MKMLMENWNRFINEELDLSKAQELIDANPYLKGKLQASAENMIESDKYVLIVSDDSLGHVKDRHTDANAPGSLFMSDANLRDVMTKVLSMPASEESGGRVKWLGVDYGSPIGAMGVKVGDPEEVAKMKDYTMPGGRNETVKVAPGEREPTGEISLITAELGEMDGKKVLSLITAFPGGVDVDGKEMPMDRNDFAKEGFYFVLPDASPLLKESKQDHIRGIEAKLERLSDAIDDATRGMENMERGVGYSATPDEDLMDIRSTNQYFAKQVEVMNLEDKIDLLKKQLEQLKQDVPGQLEKPRNQ